MQQEQLIITIREALTEAAKLVSAEVIDNNASLRDSYGLDSMSSLAFLLLLEEKVPRFIVNIETLEERHLKNIMSVAEYVDSELKLSK